MKLQTINIGGAACAIVPLKDYDLLQEALEDAADAEALRLGRADEAIPCTWPTSCARAIRFACGGSIAA